MKLKLLTFLCLIIVNSQNFYAQVTSRLTIYRGNSVYFTMNSLDKLENGIEYTDWLEYNVSFTDIGDPLNTWQLTVHTASLTITGDGGNSLPLNSVYVRATSPSAQTPVADGGWVALSNVASQVLTQGNQGAGQQVLISFRCGMPPAVSIINAVTDFYYADLIFTLGPD